MADDAKIYAVPTPLRQVGHEIIALGDSADAAVTGTIDLPGTGEMATGALAGFALSKPLSQIPSAMKTAGHTLAGRFYVLGDLVETAANNYQNGDEAVARSITSAGDLNEFGSSKR